jgi:hypothetical protein
MVNDVEVRSSTALHPGDVLRQGDVQYLVLPVPGRASAPRGAVLPHWVWQTRVDEEIAVRAEPFTLLLGRSGAFSPEFLSTVLADAALELGGRRVPATFGVKTLEFLILGSDSSVESFRQLVSDRAAQKEETVRWGTASYPRHGATAEELWSVAVDRLLGLEARDPGELVWSDPCMARLRSFAERWSRCHALALVGPEGVGRESLARVVGGTGTASSGLVVHRAARFDRASWNEDTGRAMGGSLHVRRPEMLPDGERRAFWAATSFRPSAGVTRAERALDLPENRVVLPALADRPADVAAIAELVLHSVDAQLGRRRSSLRTETRALLQRLPVSENVRTLRNLVIRAALSASVAEVRPEHLDLPSTLPTAAGVRAKVRETERREIEAALHGSGWNVTEAARRMELPRRTLVYRMARLGLRRPKGASR